MNPVGQAQGTTLTQYHWPTTRFNISAALLLSYVVSLTILTVRLPSLGDFSLSVSSARTLIYLILVFSFILVMEEVRFVYLWCARRAPRTPHPLLAALLGAACRLLITTWQVEE